MLPICRACPVHAGAAAAQELLGHATMEMTLRYSHLTPDARHSAVDALNDSVAGHGTLKAQIFSDDKKANNFN